MSSARFPFVALALAFALVCAALGAVLAFNSVGERHLARAGEDVSAGRGGEALAELDGLGGDFSRRADALRGAAYVHEGRLREARAALERAVRRAPNDWVLRRDLAIVLLAAGARARARASLRRARALNPRMALPDGFVAAR